MSQDYALHLSQQFLARMGSGAEPAEIAKLFSENMEWEIAGDTGALPRIGKKSGRIAVIDSPMIPVRWSNASVSKVDDILAGENRAVIFGSLASKLKRNGGIIETCFAIVLTEANGEIVRFQMLEDSFAVSQAARG